MTPKLVLHIGTHKTGTTALQNVLQFNNDLLAQSGFEYPDMPVKWENVAFNRNGYWINMAALRAIGSKSLAQEENIEPCAEACREVLASGDKTLVLSDERLWHNGTKKGFWQAVRSAALGIGAKDIQIVLYLRRQDLYMESLWAQFVKTGKKCISLAEYANSKKSMLVCDYAAGIKRLQKVFGPDAVTVRIYDRSRLLDGDIVADFAAVLGIADASVWRRPAGKDNPSLTPSVTLLKLAVNQSELYERLGKHFVANEARKISAQDPVKKGSFFTPQQRKELLDRYEAGNDWVAREVCGLGGENLFAATQEELEAQAYAPDGMKLVSQALEFASDALSAQERAHQKELAALEAKVRRLENSRSLRLARALRRLLPGAN